MFSLEHFSSKHCTLLLVTQVVSANEQYWRWRRFRRLKFQDTFPSWSWLCHWIKMFLPYLCSRYRRSQYLSPLVLHAATTHASFAIAASSFVLFFWFWFFALAATVELPLRHRRHEPFPDSFPLPHPFYPAVGGSSGGPWRVANGHIGSR